MVRIALLIAAAAPAAAFNVFSGSRVQKSHAATSYRSSLIMESFGFDFAEDSYENTPEVILGESRLKTWVNSVNDNAFLNRQYNVIARTRELELLKKTVDSGILTSLEEQGLTLKDIEALLPLADKLGALDLVANNQQLLLNGVGFLAVEGAPFIIPVLGNAIKTGPVAFYGAAAALAAAEGGLIVNNVKVPFVGLDAGFYLGLLLVPLAVLLAGVGNTLAGLKK